MTNRKFEGLRIYAQRGVRQRALVRPRLVPRLGAALLAPVDPLVVERGSMEDQILWILGAPPNGTETAEQSLQRKERELMNAFAALDAERARALHGRLAEAHPADPVPAAFARLSSEARARLLACLTERG